MKLTDLNPQLVRATSRGFTSADRFEDAQGVLFECPKCLGEKSHSILCWFRDRGVPDGLEPGPARWPASGSGLHDLTLTPSVRLMGGCAWHGFIRSGQVTSV